LTYNNPENNTNIRNYLKIICRSSAGFSFKTTIQKPKTGALPGIRLGFLSSTLEEKSCALLKSF